MKKAAFLKLISLTLAMVFILLSFAGCGIIKPKLNTKLNGTSIDKYTIVYNPDSLDYNLRAAEYIQSRIEALGYAKLEIKKTSEGSFEHEIVVGETDRAISAALNAERKGLEFSMLSDGNHVALEGDYFIIAAAAYYFVKTFVEDGAGDAVVPTEMLVREPVVEEANNFILLIGDGMGEAQTKLFEAYDVPTEGDTAYSDGEDFFYGYLFPYLGTSRTDSLDGTTDSAAGGTALASGYKTHNEYIGRDGNGADVVTLTELACSIGKAAAVMSTEKNTGATPASFSAHANDRDESSEILKSLTANSQKHGFIVDCGYDYYTANQLKIVEKHIADTLSKVDADEDGFFLMYEEAYIDKHCHNNDADTTFEAIMRFNQAIGRFMEYAFYNPDTMVIITADHETGGLAINDGVCTYSSEDHTSTDVKIFAYGVGAEVFNGVTVENTQIAKTIAAFMGADSFGDPATAPALTK